MENIKHSSPPFPFPENSLKTRVGPSMAFLTVVLAFFFFSHIADFVSADAPLCIICSSLLEGKCYKYA